MLDPKHPLVLALMERGYKVTAHAYFRGGLMSLCTTAHDPKSKGTFHGRSRTGSFEEAIDELARAVGLRTALLK
jgi:hypothetical protein